MARSETGKALSLRPSQGSQLRISTWNRIKIWRSCPAAVVRHCVQRKIKSLNRAGSTPNTSHPSSKEKGRAFFILENPEPSFPEFLLSVSMTGFEITLKASQRINRDSVNGLA